MLRSQRCLVLSRKKDSSRESSCDDEINVVNRIVKAPFKVITNNSCDIDQRD